MPRNVLAYRFFKHRSLTFFGMCPGAFYPTRCYLYSERDLLCSDTSNFPRFTSMQSDQKVLLQRMLYPPCAFPHFETRERATLYAEGHRAYLTSIVHPCYNETRADPLHCASGDHAIRRSAGARSVVVIGARGL